MTTILDEAFDRFADCGAEFGPGLANHGPMASDALVALGRTESIAPWVDRYIRKLEPAAAPTTAIEPGAWREALGDYGRWPGWQAFFERELDLHPWENVLRAWVPRLAPGFLASGTHGMLRTAHAVRALAAEQTPQRRAELGRGLAFWAARYTTLPVAAPAGPALPLAEAIPAVPVVPPQDRKPGRLITGTVAQLAEHPEFAPVIHTLDLGGDLDARLSSFTATFARIYLENAAIAPIAFIHSVTAPSAIRMLAPVVGPETSRDLLRYAWQAGAAFLAVYTRPGTPAVRVDDVAASYDDLADRAVASADEHAIKFTEACLREHRLNPEPVFLAAAADVSARLRLRD